jgi:hypothetical protein
LCFFARFFCSLSPSSFETTQEKEKKKTSNNQGTTITPNSSKENTTSIDMSSSRLFRQKLDRWVETSSRNLSQKIHRMNAMQRFPLKVKVVLVMPVIVYLLLFKIAAQIPPNLRPEIDVKTLPTIESAITFGYELQHWPRPLLDDPAYLPLVNFLDLLAAFVYVIHFGFWAIFAIYLFTYYKKNENSLGPVLQPWTFLWIWGLLNLTAVSTQLAWPTAPPW